MHYMIIEKFKNQDARPVYLRFRQFGRLMPDGLRYIQSWVDKEFTRCFQVIECHNESLLEEWMRQWNDLVDFEVIPIHSSEEAAKEISSRLDSKNVPTQIDTSLVAHTLTLSPEERIEAHEAARQLVTDLQKAGKTFYEEQS